MASRNILDPNLQVEDFVMWWTGNTTVICENCGTPHPKTENHVGRVESIDPTRKSVTVSLVVRQTCRCCRVNTWANTIYIGEVPQDILSKMANAACKY